MNSNDSEGHRAYVPHISHTELREAEQTALLPCPFCGADGVLSTKRQDRPNGADFHLFYFVICANTKCGCALRWTHHPMAAVRMWNRRLVKLTAQVRAVEPAQNLAPS